MLLKKNPQKILQKLKLTLEKNGLDYKKAVEEFGQVYATEKRVNGKDFSINNHVKGLILSMLSNQRPWGAVAKNMKKIDEIFFHFNAGKLEQAEYEKLLDKITQIQCGNRNIRNQLRDLSYNIKVFRKIKEDFGSIDKFVISKTPEEIASVLSNPKSNYKLKQIGFTLAMEYLRNVGIRGMKPDLHLLRICGHERLGIFLPKTSPEKATKIFKEFCKKANANQTYVDNLFWLFGAKDYANICSAKPKCHLCNLREYCNYPKAHPISGNLKFV